MLSMVIMIPDICDENAVKMSRKCEHKIKINLEIQILSRFMLFMRLYIRQVIICTKVFFIEGFRKRMTP